MYSNVLRFTRRFYRMKVAKNMAPNNYLEGMSRNSTMCSSIVFALSLHIFDDGRFLFVFNSGFKVFPILLLSFLFETIESLFLTYFMSLHYLLLLRHAYKCFCSFHRSSWRIVVNDCTQRVVRRLISLKENVQLSPLVERRKKVSASLLQIELH